MSARNDSTSRCDRGRRVEDDDDGAGDGEREPDGVPPAELLLEYEKGDEGIRDDGDSA